MILIYTQNWDGKFKKLSYELVSYGAAIAKQMNTEVVALSIGNVANNELQSLGKYGASKVVSVNDPNLSVVDNKIYAKTISEAVNKYNAKVILFANNNEGKAIAPRISAKFKAALITGVGKLPKSVEPFVICKKVYTGKASVDVKVNSDIKVLTLFQNSFGVVEAPVDAEIETLELTIDTPTIKVIEQSKSTGKVLLNDAEIVVSGGRGMKSGDNWAGIEQLAEILNGGTACSRPVSDEGWRPHGEHVGQTGKIIAPNVYFALGISGAIQHLGGVSNSKCIVAINTDKEAPIFEAADYGIIGDVHKILPELIEEVKKLKS
ncbi:MAG: electron transfer flavoprotein subunit alpha/FixB family protein [Bacteroidales bacterium]|nr:electron transfer flavoprotein subunit alpha/FixB family protein [Bacteroidales bacterium]